MAVPRLTNIPEAYDAATFRNIMRDISRQLELTSGQALAGKVVTILNLLGNGLLQSILSATWSNGKSPVFQDGAFVAGESGLPLTGGTMAGDINMDGNSITGLPSPTDTSDASTKAYADIDGIENVKKRGAVGNGVANDTTAFTNAGANAFVPTGTYAVTAIPPGLWGMGDVFVSGTFHPIPQYPLGQDLIDAKLSKYADIRSAYGVEVHLGDSIATGVGLSDWHDSFPTLSQRATMRQAGGAGSEVFETYFLDNTFGFTVKDGSGNVISSAAQLALCTSNKGCLGTSIVLPNNYELCWTRTNHAYTDFSYYRHSGYGHALLKANGTTIKDVDCNGGDAELYSGTNISTGADEPTATGLGNVSVNYSIKASGGSINILGVFGRTTLTAQTIYTLRCSYPGAPSGHFVGNALVASILNHMKFCSTAANRKQVGRVLISLGENDYASGTSSASSATFLSNLITIGQQIKAAGHYVDIISMYRTTSSPAIGGETFENYVQAQRRAAAILGVGFIPMDGIDFVGRSLTLDGTHLSKDGHRLYYKNLARYDGNPNNLPKRVMSNSWTPALTFNDSETGFAYSVRNGAYWVEGPVIHFYGRIITSAIGSGVGSAKISGLPIPASQGPIPSIKVMSSTGVSLSNATLAGQTNNDSTIQLIGLNTSNGAKTDLTNSNFPGAGGVLDLYFEGSYWMGVQL